MKDLLRSLLIALIPACPLIFSNCETSDVGTQDTEHPHDGKENQDAGEKLFSNSFRVIELRCIDCDNRLKTRLEHTPGINSASVNFNIVPPHINTFVTHQPRVKREHIIQIIKDEGFSVEN